MRRATWDSKSPDRPLYSLFTENIITTCTIGHEVASCTQTKCTNVLKRKLLQQALLQGGGTAYAVPGMKAAFKAVPPTSLNMQVMKMVIRRVSMFFCFDRPLGLLLCGVQRLRSNHSHNNCLNRQTRSDWRVKICSTTHPYSLQHRKGNGYNPLPPGQA